MLTIIITVAENHFYALILERSLYMNDAADLPGIYWCLLFRSIYHLCWYWVINFAGIDE